MKNEMPKGIYKHKKNTASQNRKISSTMKGRKLSKEHKLNLSRTKKGKRISIEIRKKLSDAHKGNKSHFWRGGITPTNIKIRASLEYKLWRTAVFIRDNRTCVWCGYMGSNINADHIKPFAYFPELRFALDNGRTLCVPCHKTTDTYGGKGRVDYKSAAPLSASSKELLD